MSGFLTLILGLTFFGVFFFGVTVFVLEKIDGVAWLSTTLGFPSVTLT